ncbi:MAG: ABC transporter permease, partial [Acholeplasma sp.]|nr:ABC transporter permease [Acholeplasma sp.]
MTEKDIIIHSSKNRILFTMIGLVLSGIVLVISMFYLEALSHSISKSIPLKPNEYHLFMDETRFESVPKNYYQTLKENMSEVIPFIVRDDVFTDQQIQIIGTDLSGLKIYQNQQFYDLEMTQSLTTTTAYPKISVDTSFYDLISNPIIQLNTGTFEIQSVFELKNGVETPYPVVLMDLHSMANHIDGSIRSSASGIEKFYVEHYYIQSNLSIDETVLYLETMYGDPAIMAFLQTHDSLLQERMQTF